jgi:hypothetical protein
MLMGHHIRLDTYIKPTPLQVIQDYVTHAAEALTIDPSQRLKQENQDLKTIQANEIEKLKSRLTEAEERNKRVEKNADDAIRLTKTLLEDFESFIKTGHHKPGIRYDFT